jgi:hypothetical protein
MRNYMDVIRRLVFAKGENEMERKLGSQTAVTAIARFLMTHDGFFQVMLENLEYETFRKAKRDPTAQEFMNEIRKCLKEYEEQSRRESREKKEKEAKIEKETKRKSFIEKVRKNI